MKRFSLFLFTLLLLAPDLYARNLLKYDSTIDLSNQKGKAFLALMKETIKPALDEKALNGFQVKKGSEIKKSLRLVDQKVFRKAVRAAGSEENLFQLADQLHEQYEQITFYDLPNALAKLGVGGGRYDLTTFYSLVSEGGVAVKIDANNITYNVNYGTGDQENDERTGRSFAESFDRMALDASDKHYLEILQTYVRGNKENTGEFYQTILSTLLNSDVSNVKNIEEEGQIVFTDFLAVYIAEQNRHLMSNLERHPWDEALLEVTLLSSFHAGQKKVKVMYSGELTDRTYVQNNGCDIDAEKKEKNAEMSDYWQFSSNSDPQHCKRSGINITRKEFRLLGSKITAYLRSQNPELVSEIEGLLDVKKSKNLYADLSRFLINKNAPEKYSKDTLRLTSLFAEFLSLAQDQADDITAAVESGEL
jgi:hypothetical protein